MDIFQTLVMLMLVALLLVGIAQKLNIPYPILLVLEGIGMGFIPGLKEILFDSYLMLTVVLPPILFHAAYNISFREFKHHLSEIFSLALGLVFATTLIIGLLFKYLFPDLPWALAFAFGAIVSPSDAATATAVLQKFTAQKHLKSVLEGESLVNDASGLVLYRLAVVALLTGSFSLTGATMEFSLTVIGGIFVGLVVGVFGNLLSSRFFDSVLAVVFSFILPYIAYGLADASNVSGVLAVVTAGLVGSRLLVTHFSSLTRILARNSWNIAIILLNCFIFVLIGSQLHLIVKQMTATQIIAYFGYSVIFTLVMIIIRLGWVYFNRLINYYLHTKDYNTGAKKKLYFKQATIVGWAGMRGIVSLIASLALPIYLPNGEPLPGRNIVIFMTFVVICLTIVIPGLSLSKLIQWLHLPDEKNTEALIAARQQLIQAAEEEIHHLHTVKKIDAEEEAFLLNYFQSRHHMLEISSAHSNKMKITETARQQVLKRQHHYLMHVWDRQEIDDYIFNLLERELDIADGQHIVQGYLH
jgi:monovalent cation/hydrogen antiporter